MGIRFRCHHCEHELNLKEFQAGRRGKCPACSGKFRVPTASADFSAPLEDAEAAMAGSSAHSHASGSGTFDLKPSHNDPERSAGRAFSQTSPRTSRSSHSTAKKASVKPAEPEQNAAPAMPAAIAEAPDSIWYVRPPSGGQYGPADAHIFWTWLQDQRVSADSLVWRDGWPQWMAAGDAFEEFFGSSWRVTTGSDSEASADQPVASTEPTVPWSADAGTPNKPLSSPDRSDPIQTRRKKQQTNYAIFIAVLAIFAIALAVVLARVLLK